MKIGLSVQSRNFVVAFRSLAAREAFSAWVDSLEVPPSPAAVSSAVFANGGTCELASVEEEAPPTVRDLPSFVDDDALVPTERAPFSIPVEII